MGDVKSLAEAWFAKAENDLLAARLIIESHQLVKPYDAVCFHCQQVAEKYLKGILTLLEIDFPKTHNIEVLLDLLNHVYTEASRCQDTVALTPYAVESRYPDDYVPFEKEEAEQALKLALSIKDLVMKISAKTELTFGDSISQLPSPYFR